MAKSKIDEALELLRESRAKILSGKGDITSVREGVSEEYRPQV